MAFALVLACVLLALSGHCVPYEMKADKDFAALLALACGSWVIRTYLLPRRKQVDLILLGRAQPYGTSSRRISG